MQTQIVEITDETSGKTFEVTAPADLPDDQALDYAIKKLSAYMQNGVPGAKIQENILNQQRQQQQNPPLMDQATGALPTIVSGAVAQPVGAAWGIANIPFRPEQARGAADDLASSLTIEPRTEAGRIGMENLAQTAPIQWLVNTFAEIKPFLQQGGGDVAEFYFGEQGRKYGEAIGDFLPEIAEGAAVGPKLARGLAQAPGAAAQGGKDLLLAGYDATGKTLNGVIDTAKKISPGALRREEYAQAAFDRGEFMNKDTAGYRLIDGRVQPHASAQEAIDNGFEPLTVNHIKHANDATKAQARRMVDLRDRIERGLIEPEAGEMRAADIVGQSIRKRYEHLHSVIDAARQRRNAAVDDLRGKTIDLQTVTDNFAGRLDEIGIGYKRTPDGGFDPSEPLTFEDSVFALNKQAQNKVQEFVNTMANAGRVDAHKAHIYKLGIDDMVGYGRQAADGLTGKAEDLFKGMRHDLNEAIRQVSTPYAEANDVMSGLLDTVKEVDDLIGKKYDPTDRQFGLLSRTTLTNMKQGDRVRLVMSALTEKANQYGGQFDDNLMTLTRLYTDMNKVIRPEAPGGFGGLVQGADVRRGPLDTVIDVGIREIGALRNNDRYTAINSIKALLDE